MPLSTVTLTSRRTLILLFFSLTLFALLAPACAGQGEEEVDKSSDTTSVLILDHPLETHIEFAGPVSKQDRQLVALAVDITRPLFQSTGFALGADIYVAGDRDSYLELAQTKLGMSPELAAESFVSFRGTIRPRSAEILINLPLHYTSYSEKNRNSTLVFTVSHELYHVLQARFSEGWTNVLHEPHLLIGLSESSANLGAYRAMLNAFCVPLAKINAAISSFERVPQCPRKFVEDTIFTLAALAYDDNPNAGNSFELYIIAKFGIDVYDRLYAAVAEEARTFSIDNLDTLRREIWPQTIEKTFGAPINELVNTATTYIEEHREAIVELLNKYTDKYFE